jgi:hypothetical protein
LFTVAAAAVAIGLGAAPAVAAGATWTIKPGGSATYTGGTTTVKDSSTGAELACSSSKWPGTLKSGSGLKGTGAGSITSGSFTGCSTAGIDFTLTPLDLPWKINLLSYANGVVHGTISHIEMSASAPGCSFVIDGTAGGASDGKLDFSYTESTGKLKLSDGDLHVYDVDGCFGIVNTGDPVTVTATFKITPKQTITRS